MEFSQRRVRKQFLGTVCIPVFQAISKLCGPKIMQDYFIYLANASTVIFQPMQELTVWQGERT